jgi:hypothetical protein
MIRSTDVALLLSGWKDEGVTVKAVLIDEDKISRCVIEGKISRLNNALITIQNARNYMVANLEGSEFDYGDSREFDEHESVYSDLVNGRLSSGMYFAIAVLRQKTV